MPLLLKEIPTLDNIDIAAWHTGDLSRGVKIIGPDTAGGRGGTDTAAGSGKGKEKIASSGSSPKVGSQPPSGNTKVSSEDDVALQRRKRLFHSDGPIVGEPHCRATRSQSRLPHRSLTKRQLVQWGWGRQVWQQKMQQPRRMWRR
jgi:hypothetical protein